MFSVVDKGIVLDQGKAVLLRDWIKRHGWNFQGPRKPYCQGREGRRFFLRGENLTLGTGSVLAGFQTAAAGSAASIVEIERVEISQNHNNTSAQVRLTLGTRNTSGTLTMTSSAPQPLVIGGPSSGLSGNTNILGTAGTSGINSSADSGGTYTDGPYANPNNQGGFLWTPTERDGKLLVAPSTIFVVRFMAAPGDTAGWTITILLHEAY